MCGSNGKKNTLKYFTRNVIISILSGILFATGWWLIIDATVQYPALNKIYHLIGVIATLALILTNSISNSQVRGDSISNKCLTQFAARLFLLFSFILVFGSLIASAWVLFGYYIPSKREQLYPGIAIFGQNLAIALSTLIFKLGRKEEDNSY